MTLARLVAVALAFCSMPAFAQDQQPQSTSPSTQTITVHIRKGQNGPSFNEEVFFPYPGSPTAATPAEPWRLIPDRPAEIPSGYNALDPSRLDRFRFDQVKSDPQVSHLNLDTFDADTTCYAIRSYVVARDSKGSDSTHPAGYSTCQVSSRYQVKTADMRVVSGER